MKKILIIVLSILLIAALPCQAEEETITFNWDQVISPDFAGWKLYKRTSPDYAWELASTIEYSGQPEGSYEVDLTLPAVGDGEETTYYFVLTAFDTVGNESAHSNEVTYVAVDKVPPAIPQQLTVTINPKL